MTSPLTAKVPTREQWEVAEPHLHGATLYAKTHGRLALEQFQKAASALGLHVSSDEPDTRPEAAKFGTPEYAQALRPFVKDARDRAIEVIAPDEPAQQDNGEMSPREAAHMEFVHDCADVLQTVVDEGIKHPDTAWALRDILQRARALANFDIPPPKIEPAAQQPSDLVKRLRLFNTANWPILLEAADRIEALEAAAAQPDYRHALQVILPMAKGYAHAHQVGANLEKIQWVEEMLATPTAAAQPTKDKPRPTIAELEALLASEGDEEIEILPDGSIRPKQPLEEKVAWAILQALHENVPEAARPLSWSDLNGDQEQRIRAAAKAVIKIAQQPSAPFYHGSAQEAFRTAQPSREAALEELLGASREIKDWLGKEHHHYHSWNRLRHALAAYDTPAKPDAGREEAQ